jgi:predicted RNase H-like HicB family nuclease
MVKYSEVIALCLEAIKEQSLLLNEKEERLEKLEMKVK